MVVALAVQRRGIMDLGKEFQQLSIAEDPARPKSSRRQALCVPPKLSYLSSFGSLRASFPKLY
jgi:hypothetical protein